MMLGLLAITLGGAPHAHSNAGSTRSTGEASGETLLARIASITVSETKREPMKSRSAAKAFGLAVVLGLACAGVTAAKADPSLEYRAQALAVHDIAVGQEGG